MRIHTNTLTESDLRAALPDGVHMNIMEHGSRKRARAFEVTLYVWDRDELHRRFGNSGGYGADQDKVAATWDEWGIWMAKLYELEDDVVIGWYESHEHFIDMTRQVRDQKRAYNKATSIEVRTHTAPWLSDSEVKA